MSRSPFALPVLSLLALASSSCGPSSEQAPPATPPAGTATPATAAAPASAAATAAPSASGTAAPEASASATADATPPKPAKPTFQFWSFDGPAEGPALTGPRAWTAVAAGAADDRYRRVFISVEDFVKAVSPNNHFRSPNGDIISPIAMGAPLAPPAALKKGDPVLAENSNDSAYGRVVSVDGDTVKMKDVFGALVGEHEAPKSEVLLLDGTLRLGTPVAFKRDGKWFAGKLLAKVADDAWIGLNYVDGEPYVKVKAADVKAIDVKKVLRVGDKCVADTEMHSKNELLPGKVTKVIEDGMFYEVTLDKGATKWSVPFHRVSAPL